MIDEIEKIKEHAKAIVKLSNCLCGITQYPHRPGSVKGCAKDREGNYKGCDCARVVDPFGTGDRDFVEYECEHQPCRRA